MNWRKHPSKRAGMYWARLGPEDKDPKVIQVIDGEGLFKLDLAVEGHVEADRGNLERYFCGERFVS
jgi:hypothetical protein